ncbi:MAG TPA: NAD-dependent epimerase/dehydratase family protein [Candidatus Paceibacterota bacterium]|nr:NAD-dependent epimerase/dehydratase family protein [Candidatus Paceibacterota bacterium]
MKIIVTGGAGFIASHVVDAYIKAGHRVVVIDNLATGFRRNVHPKAKFYKADIRDLALMEKIFAREKPEIVNHHAAIAEVVKSLKNPIPTLEVNVLGTTNVLLAFGKYGTGAHKKFIFSSTGGAIYGEPKKIPAGESTPPVPLSPYGLSKFLDEEVIKFYARHFGFDYFIFRYPNVYGPRQNPKGEAGVIAIFGGLLKSGKRPIIFGDGTKARDYTYVGDIARANLIALRRGKNETVNIGWGKVTTDRMIFDEVARATGFSGKPIYAPYRKGEVYRIALDASKAKKILGWTPKVEFEEGVSRTIEAL